MPSRDIPVVVLAAGEGRRLSPLTNTRPKPMLPVANRPLLDHVVEAAVKAGVDELVMVVGYRQERIRNHFGDGDDWDISISYVEQDTQLGTGHAVLQVAELIDGQFLVLNGDRVISPSIIERVRAQETAPALAITQAAFPSTFGVVDVDGDRLTRIVEKPLDPSPSALINAGVYLFDESIFAGIQDTDTVDGELPITATLDRIAAETPIRTVRYDDIWLDVSYLWDLLTVNAALIAGAGDATEEIRACPSSMIAPDVALGSGVEIGSNATLGGGTTVGKNVRIGSNVALHNSVILPDAKIGAGTVLTDTIVGANATLGPNTTVEGGPADVTVADTRHRDVTLGGVVGDNAHVGGGTVLIPGAVIGNGTQIESGSRLSGTIPPEADVRRG